LVFLHDVEANFLLANDASKHVPNCFQLEAGFDNVVMSDICAMEADKSNHEKRTRSLRNNWLMQDKQARTSTTELLAFLIVLNQRTKKMI